MRHFKIKLPNTKLFTIDTTEVPPFIDLEITDSKGKEMAQLVINNGECTHIFAYVRRGVHLSPFEWTYEYHKCLIYQKYHLNNDNIFIN
jgi:hypothetical protein